MQFKFVVRTVVTFFKNFFFKDTKKKMFSPTSAGFEPTRAEPSRFRVYRLNHSAKMPMKSGQTARFRKYICNVFKMRIFKKPTTTKKAQSLEGLEPPIF